MYALGLWSQEHFLVVSNLRLGKPVECQLGSQKIPKPPGFLLHPRRETLFPWDTSKEAIFLDEEHKIKTFTRVRAPNGPLDSCLGFYLQAAEIFPDSEICVPYFSSIVWQLDEHNNKNNTFYY